MWSNRAEHLTSIVLALIQGVGQLEFSRTRTQEADVRSPDVTLVRIGLGAAGAVVGAPFINVGCFQLFGWSPQEYTRRCVDLVQDSLIIDMLGLTTLNSEVRERWGPDFSNLDAAAVAEFRDSEIDVLHIARGVGGRTADEAYDRTLGFVASFNSIIANRPDVFVRIDSAEDLDTVHGSGRTGILIGIQDSAHFRTPDDVSSFHSLGQRVSQLTYNSRNMIGNGVDGTSRRRHQ